MSIFTDLEVKHPLGEDPDVAAPVSQRAREAGVDVIYEMKCELVNECLQNEIGMGRYQWELFFLCGLGWMADNVWYVAVATTLPAVSREMQPPHIAFLSLAFYIGLLAGAVVWGVLADIIGRRLSWNLSLATCTIFGTAAGGSNNFATLGGLFACVGFGVGGNVPVDGALFLEFVPGSHQWLLTVMSAWWPVGQLAASLIAWGFNSHYACVPDVTQPCPASENKGWRYTCYTLGSLTFLMFLARYVIFKLQESPKYLLAKGRDQEALDVLQYIAKRNGRTITLSLEQLQSTGESQAAGSPGGSNFQLLKRSIRSFDMSHVKPLFSTRKLALNTSLIITCMGLVGLALPLYNAFLPIYLQQRSVSLGSGTVDDTYRTYTILAVLGIPGSFIAVIAANLRRGDGKWRFGGRRFAMALCTSLTGIFLFLFTQAKNEKGVLGFNCVLAVTQNAVYGLLYTYMPEVFPAPHRGTGCALCSAVHRVLSVLAPIIATYGDLTTNAPLFVSASLFLVTSVLMLLLPIETAGKPSI